MTADMIFDLASVTKPVATATSIMILVERGHIRLWDKVKDYVPEFATYLLEGGIAGEDARLWQSPDAHLGPAVPTRTPRRSKPYRESLSRPTSWSSLSPGSPRNRRSGADFIYSCLNYITLAHIVQDVSGKDLDEFAAENIFKPLGMTRTFFIPPADLPRPVRADGGRRREAPPRRRPRSAGPAPGRRFRERRAVLDGRRPGRLRPDAARRRSLSAVRVLSPLTVERMTEIFPKAGKPGRGLGWDIDTDYATVRGDLFGPGFLRPLRLYGDFDLDRPGDPGPSVIFLTNRVHPDDKGDIIAMRSKVANVVASSILVK